MVTNVWRLIKVKRINYKYCVALPVVILLLLWVNDVLSYSRRIDKTHLYHFTSETDYYAFLRQIKLSESKLNETGNHILW